jgi:hypothetical protein
MSFDALILRRPDRSKRPTTEAWALDVARHAIGQGREVYAVPGRVDSPSSQGCHAPFITW